MLLSSDAPVIELAPSIVAHVARASPMLAAIRAASGESLPALQWAPGLVVTDAARLPAQEAYSVALPIGRVVAATPLGRDPRLGLAMLKLVEVGPTLCLETAPPPPPGAVLLVLGADADAGPSARLTVADAPAFASSSVACLAAPPGYLPTGGPVLSESGALVGLCVTSPGGVAVVVPCSRIETFVSGIRIRAERQLRGWIGAALQPVAMRDPASRLPAPPTGRLVLRVVRDGPAARAGVRPGDILLALDGIPMTGHGSLRSLLGPELVGREVELVLTRRGRITRCRLVVEAKPAA